MKKLIIAEKASVGRTIAKVVGATERGDGYLEGPNYIVSWCRGHLVENADADAYDPRYKMWNLEDLPIIPEHWKTRAIPGTEKEVQTLFDLCLRDDVSSLVEATDAGREGELIFRLTYRFIKTECLRVKGILARLDASGKDVKTFAKENEIEPEILSKWKKFYSGNNVKKLDLDKPFERLWISSLEASAVREGMMHLKPSSDFDNLYKAALSRSRADWLFGINGTRLYTLTMDGDGVKSVGRVQTPTLAMIVARQREIDNFQEQKRWAIVKDFGSWSLETEKFTDENLAKEALAKTDGKPARIEKVERAKKKEGPPRLHSLTSLQQEANRRFGFTANHTLELMESLYLKKVLSYPRTDSNYITSDMTGTMGRIVNALGEYYKKDVPDWMSQGVKRLVDDEKVSDHYAVIVTETFMRDPDLNKLESDDERKIVKLVQTRILEAVAPWHEYEETKIEADSNGIPFFGTGRKVLVNGWKSIAPALLSSGKQTPEKAVVLPSDIDSGKEYMALKTTMEKRNTVPPVPYTDNTLLGAMERAGVKDMDENVERKGLGTSSTRAATIETLLKRNYIVRQKKYLIPTEAGIHLIDVVDEGFKSVDTTVEWENRLVLMEQGKGEDAQAFCSSIGKTVSDLVKDAPAIQKQVQILGRCPVCGEEMKSSHGSAKCSGCGRMLYRKSIRYSHEFSSDQLKTLLEGGKVENEIVSKKTGKSYKCLVSIDKQQSSENDKYIQTNFEFPNVDFGNCPVCGSPMKDANGNAKCSGCGRILFKSSRVFKREFSSDDMKALLAGKSVKNAIVSKKDNKSYDCLVSVDKQKSEENESYIQTTFSFPSKDSKKTGKPKHKK